MDTGRFIGQRFLRKLFSSVNSYTEPYVCFNTLRPRQNGRHFADDMFKCIFLNENIWIPIEISLKFVPKGSINNNPALFQIMAWRRPGNKPLSEPMMVSSLTHICITRPQWVNVVAPWRCYSIFQRVFTKHITGYLHEHFLWNFSESNGREHLWWFVMISWGNGLLSSCNKSLPEPMLTQI